MADLEAKERELLRRLDRVHEDVAQLRRERDEARAALRDLAHPWGCWCLAGGERAVDHSDACRRARAVLGET